MSNTAYDTDSDTEALKGIEKSYGAPDATNSGSKQVADAAEKQSLENAYNAPSSKNSGSQKAEDAKALEEKEEAPDRSRFSAGDDIREKLGQGYTGKGSNQSKGLSKLYNSSSAFKKKVAIAGAAAGGGALLSVVAFVALLPLKIEHVVSNLEKQYSASAQDAVGKQGNALLNMYLAKQVMPAVNSGACHSTIDAGCVVTGRDKSTPIGRVFTAWKDQKLERKLATKYNIVIGSQGSGSSRQLYMNIDGHQAMSNSQIRALMDDPVANSIFNTDNSTGSGRAKRGEVRDALKAAFKDATLWDKMYFRFKVNALLERKYGIKRCLFACTTRDNAKDSIGDKKNSAKAYVIRRVISPASENLGLIMQCILATGSDFCKTALDRANSGDDSRLSPAQKKMKEQLAAFSARYGADKLGDLVKAAEDIGKDGFAKVTARTIAKKIAAMFGKDVTGQTAEKAIPVIGWIFLTATVAKTAKDIGPMIRYMGYAANASAAVAMYSSYQSIIAETKSGHIDPEVLGSFTNALSTNLSGSPNDRSDATQTPLYQNTFNGTTQTTSVFNTLFPGKAYAADTASKLEYKCEDGNPVPANQLVCDSEKLSNGNDTANSISAFVDGIPGLSVATDIVGGIQKVAGAAFEKVYNAACTVTLGGCSAFESFIADNTAGLLAWLQGKLIPSPFTDDMSGGRTFDMMAAGADVSNNSACVTTLGCSRVSDDVAYDIQQKALAADKADFKSKSLFARVFDTTSSYSLVSNVAMAMPTTMVTASNSGLMSVITNPLSSFMGGFSGMLPGGQTASAATISKKDPFGVIQYAYSDDQIPTDPEAFWNAKCVNGPLATYNESSDTLDVSKWLNEQPQDTNTGEAYATSPNQCLLIQSTIQSVGGLFDADLLPKDAPAQSTAAASTTSTGIPSGESKDLALKIGSNPNISFQTKQGSDAFDSVISDGTQPGCGGVTISPKLLGVILQLSTQYKIVLGVFTTGHQCDGGYHSKGMAVDLNGVNPLEGTASAALEGTGNRIDWTASNLPIMQRFYADVGAILAANGGGGLGQEYCFGGPAPTVSGVSYFDDTCDHLHMDVRGM